ncbi:MAG: HNH endonuclease [Candidatus Izemoplasmatales bacterium]
MSSCIFCGEDTSSSKSVEHIIPESLGNNKIILGRGVVCDKCNNYFAREIERPFLDIEGIRNARFWNDIKSKKGKIPDTEIIVCGEKGYFRKINGNNILIMDSKGMEKFLNMKPSILLSHGFAEIGDVQNKYEIARFLLKCGYEFMIYLVAEHNQTNIDGDISFETDNTYQDLTKYVREGTKEKIIWPYIVEKITEYEVFSNKEQIEISVSIKSTGENVYFILDLYGLRYIVNLLKMEICSYKTLSDDNGTK